MSARVRDPWGERSPFPRGGSWPARVDLQLAGGVTEDDVERWVPAASLLHSNGDAMDVAVRQGLAPSSRRTSRGIACAARALTTSAHDQPLPDLLGRRRWLVAGFNAAAARRTRCPPDPPSRPSGNPSHRRARSRPTRRVGPPPPPVHGPS